MKIAGASTDPLIVACCVLCAQRVEACVAADTSPHPVRAPFFWRGQLFVAWRRGGTP